MDKSDDPSRSIFARDEDGGDLTDDEIDVAAGERDQLARKIQQNTVSAEKSPRDRLMSEQKI